MKSTFEPFLNFLILSGRFLLFCIKSNQLFSVGKNLNAILTFFLATQAIKKCIFKQNVLFCFEVWINLLRKCKNLYTQVIITWVRKTQGIADKSNKVNLTFLVYISFLCAGFLEMSSNRQNVFPIVSIHI